MDLTYTIKTNADVEQLEKFYDEQVRGVETLKASGASVDELDAKLKALEATAKSITAAFVAFHGSLAAPPADFQPFLAKLATGASPQGAAPVAGASPTAASAPPAALTPSAPSVAPAAYDVVTQEQYDLLLRAKVAAEAYLKAVTDPTSVKDAKDELEKINDSLARSVPRAEEAASAYLRMHEALTDLSLAGQTVADAGQNITTNEQLKATEELLRLEKERLATLKPGSAAYAETKTRVDDLSAAVRGCNADMIRELELLRQKALLLKQTGDAAGLAANQQSQSALKGALGQPTGLLSGAKEKGEELFRAYTQGGGGVEGFVGVLKNGGGALAGWAAGLGLLGLAAKHAADEFEQSQVAITKLDAAMAMSGQLTDENREKNHALASQLESTTAVADDKWMGVMAKLTQFGADTSNMDKYTVAVKNLAGIMGGDVESAATAVSRAMQGQFGMFSRYGIHVEEAGTQTEKMAKLFEMLAQRGGGQLEALGNTITGQKSKLANAMSNLWEGVGTGMGLAGSKWRGQLASFVDSFNEAWFTTAKPVDGLTNSVNTNKRSLEENATAADNHKKALEAIGKAAAETTKEVDGMTNAIRKQAQFEDEKADAKAALAKAKVDDDEKRGTISHEEAVRRRMQIDADSETRKMASKVSAKEKEKAFTGDKIKDVQDEIKAAETAYKAGGENLKQYLPRLTRDQSTLKELDAGIEEKKKASAEAAAAVERAASTAPSPQAAAAIREAGAKETAQRAAEIAIAVASRDKFRAGADKSARKAGFEDKGIDTNADDVTADVKRLKEKMDKTVADNQALLSKLGQGYTDLSNELVQLTEVNALKAEAINLKNRGDAAVNAAKEAAKAAVDKATEREKQIALKLETGGAALTPEVKAGLQRDLRQAELDKRTANVRRQYVESAGDPAKQRELDTELKTIAEAQKNLNRRQPAGQQLTVPGTTMPGIVTPAGTPTVKTGTDTVTAAIDKPAADAAKAEQVAARERIAAATAARQAKIEADAIAAHNRNAGPDDQRADTYFADKRAAEKRAAEIERRLKRERERQPSSALPIEGLPSASVNTGGAERTLASSGADLNAAVGRLAGAVVGPLTSATNRIDDLNGQLDVLRSRLDNMDT